MNVQRPCRRSQSRRPIRRLVVFDLGVLTLADHYGPLLRGEHPLLQCLQRLKHRRASGFRHPLRIRLGLVLDRVEIPLRVLDHIPPHQNLADAELLRRRCDPGVELRPPSRPILRVLLYDLPLDRLLLAPLPQCHLTALAFLPRLAAFRFFHSPLLSPLTSKPNSRNAATDGAIFDSEMHSKNLKPGGGSSPLFGLPPFGETSPASAESAPSLRASLASHLAPRCSSMTTRKLVP